VVGAASGAGQVAGMGRGTHYRGKRYCIIPDMQVCPGTPTEHIAWAGRAIVNYKPDVICVMGDTWDMPSLCSHEALGSKAKEGARIQDDIDAGNKAFKLLVSEMRRSRSKTWTPECHFFFGNHEERITRAIQSDPKLEGTLSLELLHTPGFRRHDFLDIFESDGIAFSHYFYGLKSGRPIGGAIPGRVHKIGRSFVAGHEQSLQYASVDYPGFRRHGLVAGSFYIHNPEYRGPQAKADWRGIVILNEVHDGDFDVMPVSMSYLERRYG
jgi:hypothetical protein